MVEWFWWDSSLILTTNWIPSVLGHCWFGHLTCKNRPRNDLLGVEWDVKPYTLTHSYQILMYLFIWWCLSSPVSASRQPGRLACTVVITAETLYQWQDALFVLFNKIDVMCCAAILKTFGIYKLRCHRYWDTSWCKSSYFRWLSFNWRQTPVNMYIELRSYIPFFLLWPRPDDLDKWT